MNKILLTVAVSLFAFHAAHAETPGLNYDPSLGEAIYVRNYKPVIGKFNERKVGYNQEHLTQRARDLSKKRDSKKVR